MGVFDTSGPSPGASTTRRRRLGELLIEAGVLDDERLKAALVEQKKWGGKLGRTLVEMGFVDETAMVQALSKQLGIPAVDLDQLSLPPEVVQLLRVDLAERYGVFPLQGDPRGRTLQVASSDPTNLEALQELGMTLGARVVPTVATGSSIDRAIRRLYYGEAARRPAPAAAPARAPAPRAAPPRSPAPSVADASLELDALLGVPASAAAPVPAAHGTELAALRRDLVLAREQIDNLEKITAGQVRALRGLVELLIESGLITRDEYLAKVHRLD